MTHNQRHVIAAINGARDKFAHLAAFRPGHPLHQNDIQTCAEQRDIMIRVANWMTTLFTRGDFGLTPDNGRIKTPPADGK